MAEILILGIDPGLSVTGFGIVKYSSKAEYVDSGIIDTGNIIGIGKKLTNIYNRVTELVKLYNPTDIAMEEVFINTNPRSSQKLIMARTAGYLACCNLGYDVYEYSPNTIKKNITGNGHASKEYVYTMLKKIIDSDIEKGKTNDSMDAVAAALCHIFTKSQNFLPHLL